VIYHFMLYLSIYLLTVCSLKLLFCFKKLAFQFGSGKNEISLATRRNRFLSLRNS
jgi:hypothetical protein